MNQLTWQEIKSTTLDTQLRRTRLFKCNEYPEMTKKTKKYRKTFNGEWHDEPDIFSYNIENCTEWGGTAGDVLRNFLKAKGDKND